MQAASAGQGAAPVDPKAARKAEEDAEERRLAEIRSHGTMVTPQTFTEWKKRFDAEMALQKAHLRGTRTADPRRCPRQDAVGHALQECGLLLSIDQLQMLLYIRVLSHAYECALVTSVMCSQELRA